MFNKAEHWVSDDDDNTVIDWNSEDERNIDNNLHLLTQFDRLV